ncbi:hypothetical protein AB0E75_04135 [Streptomyces griseoviridis]|jgi:uncharacterized oligopeptide transporter (OPT) family protein|uniref:Uncharacterized protein n=1 Tax=Streptomyces griseoviridis TaxID=45398 RepID=A0A918G8C2_STRGD|nr:hypothetical protein [Streptomyces niveoruber]GGS23420.1 hypothetical protein GCM10010238_09220 [Streptomyces niveoruber]
MSQQQSVHRGGAVWALVITSVAGFMAALYGTASAFVDGLRPALVTGAAAVAAGAVAALLIPARGPARPADEDSGTTPAPALEAAAR